MGCSLRGLQRAGHHRVKMNKCKKSKLDGTRPRVQLLSGVQLFETPWTAVHKAFLSITKSRSLLKPVSITLVIPSNHLILCPHFLPSVCSSIRVFSSESVLCIRWPKYWSCSFSISPSNEYSELIDWLDLLAVQKTLKSLLQHHSSNINSLGSSFFKVELSHPHMTTGKPQPSLYGPWLVKWCLCFLIYCLGLSKLFFQEAIILISWLQSLSVIILEPSKIKPHCFHCFSIYLSRSDGNGCHSVKFSLVT